MELNSQLQTLRERLFGEGEISPEGEKGPMPSVAACISDAHDELQKAHSQVSSILNRL